MQPIETIVFEPEGCLMEEGDLYEDVIPVLAELKAMGVQMFSTSETELLSTVDTASLNPERTIFLTTTEAGLRSAKSAGFRPILMMNDPDEARRLAMLEPAGGIVSLHELPDFIRLLKYRHEVESSVGGP